MLLALAAVTGACGYTSSPALLPSHLKTVAIPAFENGTTEVTLEQEVTDAVIARFVSNNQLKVVDQRTADCLIQGRINSYRNSVFGFSGSDALSQEYRVAISVAVLFKDLRKNREIWNDPDLVKTANYYVTPVPGDTAKTERDGRREAVLKIADEILTRTIQGW
jgi:Lipopolysaccharide-assembly